MSTAGRAAGYPDADAVMRAFVGSGRRHLLLTGSRHTGKTTLLRLLCGGNVYPGVTTHAVPRDCVVMTENLTGNTAVVGRYDPSLPGTERKMVSVPDGFSEFGAAILHHCGEASGEWVTVDEIGYLEGDSTDYLAALHLLMEKKRLIAVVRKQTLPHIRALLQRDDVFTVDLDRMYGRAGCVIMASGMGVRFGGNKLMAEFGGAPMIRRILDATEGIFDRRVVVTRHADVAEFCTAYGIEVILHDLPHRSDTVRIGLEAIGGTIDACMFCPGDQPLLKRSTVAALAMAAAGDRRSMFRAAFDGTVGAPVIFPAWTFPALLTLPEGKGGGYVLKQYPDCVRAVSAADRLELTDADTKEILCMLEQHL